MDALVYRRKVHTLNKRVGTSLVVLWLRLQASTAEALVHSLAGELRSHKPHTAAKEFFFLIKEEEAQL